MLKAHSEKRGYRHKKEDLKLMKKVCFQLNFEVKNILKLRIFTLIQNCISFNILLIIHFVFSFGIDIFPWNLYRWEFNLEETHQYSVYNVLSKKINTFVYRVQFVSRKILVMLYNAFILPHITYGLEFWGAACKTFMNPILILQKRRSRVIMFIKRITNITQILYFWSITC